MVRHHRSIPGRGRVRAATTASLLALAATGVYATSLATAAEGVLADPSAAATVAPSAVEPAPTAPDDVAEQAPADTGVVDIDVSDAGRVRKELGEPAGIALAGAEDASFQITLDAISVLTQCPSRGVTLAPEHGYFVVIDLVAIVDGAAAGLASPDLFMPVVADSFGVLGPDGTAQASPTEASWGCYEDGELAAPFVGAGETTTGKVVLDSAVPAGTLVYTPGGNTGWEWDFE